MEPPNNNIKINNASFTKELLLLSSYNASLEKLVKIEEELALSRKKNESKIAFLNQSVPIENVVVFKNGKLVNKRHIEDENVTDNQKFSSDSDDSFLINNLTTSKHDGVLAISNCSDFMMKNLPLMEFKKQLDELYNHLVNNYNKEEKILSKYFDIARSVRERAIVNLTKNELLRLKTKKTNPVDLNCSLKKKQRALLMKLQHEYNEIKKMKNFQKKLSDNKRRIIIRQFKHFKTMLTFNSERKNSLNNSSCLKSPNFCQKENHRYPLKCFNVLLNNENYTTVNNNNLENYLESYKKKLDRVLQLHLDLQINMASLKSISDKHSNYDAIQERLMDSSENFVILKENEAKTEAECSSKSKSLFDEAKTTKIVAKYETRNVYLESSHVLKLNASLHSNFTDSIISHCPTENNKRSCFILNLLNYLQLSESAKGTHSRVLFTNVFEKIIYLQKQVYDKSLVFEEQITYTFDIICGLLRFLLNDDAKYCGKITFQVVKTYVLENLHDIMFKMNNIRADVMLKIIRNVLSKHKGIDLRVNLQSLQELKDHSSDFENKTQSRNCELLALNAIKPCQAIEDVTVKPKKFFEVHLNKEKFNEALNKSLEDDFIINHHEKKLREKFVSCSSIVYEELKKKELAVEMEIKALLEQQTSQIPYFIVREIPDKPPPPYIPPNEDLKNTYESNNSNNDFGDIDCERVRDTVKFCFKRLWLQFLAHEYTDWDEANAEFDLKCRSVRSNSPNVFLFDLCNELFVSEYRDSNKKRNSWDYRRFASSNRDVCKRVEDLAKRHLGLVEDVAVRNSIYVNCAHKMQDHVDELLARELQSEESEWVNIEEHASIVKNALTETILGALINETVDEYQFLY